MSIVNPYTLKPMKSKQALHEDETVQLKALLLEACGALIGAPIEPGGTDWTPRTLEAHRSQVATAIVVLLGKELVERRFGIILDVRTSSPATEEAAQPDERSIDGGQEPLND